jgi:hypothetical protein
MSLKTQNLSSFYIYSSSIKLIPNLSINRKGIYCQSEGYKGVENKSDLKRAFERCYYKEDKGKINKLTYFTIKRVIKYL